MFDDDQRTTPPRGTLCDGDTRSDYSASARTFFFSNEEWYVGTPKQSGRMSIKSSARTNPQRLIRIRATGVHALGVA